LVYNGNNLIPIIKRKNMKSIFKITTISLVLLVCACDSILEIEPQQSVAAAQALTTAEGIKASLANIYSGFKNVLLYGRDFTATSEALADNVSIIDRAGGRYVQQGANAPTANLGNWAYAYAKINEINLLLEALPNVAGASPTFIDETEGQAKTMRALLYFDLMRAYAYEPNMAPPGQDKGGVPLALTGIILPSQIELLPRASIADCYAQIYSDLSVGIAKAPPQAAGAKYYVTRTFANALFAKVALYNQDYVQAEQFATDAITLGTLVPAAPADVVPGWRLNNHPESIFEVGFTTPGETIGVNESITSAYASRLTLSQVPPTTATGNAAVVPTAALLALHAATDVRRALYQTGLRGSPPSNECTKFLHKTGTTYMDNIPVMRVSEIYLIRAEARARKAAPDEPGAISDLNLIAARVPIVYNGTTTGTALIDAIIAQRRLELAFEGDRWFDLKRRGAPLIKSTGNLQFDDYRRLAPIPVREIQINPNLVQNTGY
jgi:hypothetical protein